MARILWLGDAGAHTGFARVTEAIGNRLVETYGHSVDVLAVNYRGDPWDTKLRLWVPTLLKGSDLYGLSRVVELIAETLPDVIVILNDPTVVLRMLVDNQYDTERVLLHLRPLLLYLPVDGYDNPPVWDVLAEAGTRVAMSAFGQAAMPGSRLVAHGVDSERFRPSDKQDAKRTLGFDPNRKLILRVDKNSVRKNYADSWRAVRPILRARPDVDVHFHCLPREPMEGVDLKAFVSVDADVRDRLTFSQHLGGFTGWREELMPLLYNAADVFLSTSTGEGFGLTIAEALACGTPVVATDCSAITEVVGPGGRLVPPGRPWTAPMGQTQYLPDIDGITAALDELLGDKRLRHTLGARGREHVTRSFSWDVAAQRFHSLITELASPSDPQEEVDVPEVQAAYGVTASV